MMHSEASHEAVELRNENGFVKRQIINAGRQERKRHDCTTTHASKLNVNTNLRATAKRVRACGNDVSDHPNGFVHLKPSMKSRKATRTR